MTYSYYAIGLTTGSMLNLGVEANSVLPAPKGDPVKYSQYIPLADGSTRGLGWYWVDWNFGYLTASQRTILRAYCPSPQVSQLLYIVTRTLEGDAYDRFQGYMIWPQVEKRDYLRRPNFIVRFNRLVAA